MITRYTTDDEVWVPMRIHTAIEYGKGEVAYTLKDPEGLVSEAWLREQDIVEVDGRREFRKPEPKAKPLWP